MANRGTVACGPDLPAPFFVCSRIMVPTAWRHCRAWRRPGLPLRNRRSRRRSLATRARITPKTRRASDAPICRVLTRADHGQLDARPSLGMSMPLPAAPLSAVEKTLEHALYGEFGARTLCSGNGNAPLYGKPCEQGRHAEDATPRGHRAWQWYLTHASGSARGFDGAATAARGTASRYPGRPCRGHRRVTPPYTMR